MIRFITAQDFAQIFVIWQACFGDPEDYVRFFWAHCFPLCRGLGFEQDGRLVSMLFLLPGALGFHGTFLPASYVYAVATLPEFRGRGLAGALARHGEAIAREEGQAALCLLPANAGLYQYYAKLGYVNAFTRQIFDMHINGTPAEFDSALAYKYRKQCWGEPGYFSWSPPLLDYMAKEHLLRGGKILLEESGYEFVSPEGVAERCVCAPGKAPGGMLKPLDNRAASWLKSTQGCGYLGLTLE